MLDKGKAQISKGKQRWKRSHTVTRTLAELQTCMDMERDGETLCITNEITANS